MALRASTQLGPPAVGGGCQSPVNNSQLLVTKAAAAVFSYGPSTTAGQGYSYFPIDKNIRCTHEGVLKTLAQIQADAGVANPSANATANVLPGIQVKRPNCECTNFSKFVVTNYQPSNPNTTLVDTYTFSDGYSINLGLGNKMLVVKNTGLEFANPTAGEYVVACQSYGKTTDVSSGCIKVESVSNFTVNSSTGMIAGFPETDYPQDIFSNSTIRASIMLENGVYIFHIPTGGSY